MSTTEDRESRIGILCYDISCIGGVETVSLNLARKLQRECYFPFVITCKNADNINNIENIPIISAGVLQNSSCLEKTHIDAICKAVLENRITKIIVQLNVPYKWCLVANLNLLKRLSQITSVSLRIHGSPKSFITRYRLHNENIFIYLLKVLYTQIKHRPYAKFFLKQAAQSVEEIVTLSRGCQTELKKYFGIDSVVKYNVYELLPIDDNIKKDKFALWVGRLDGVKNIYFILDAWKYISNNYDWHLFIVGDGGEADRLQNYIRNNEIKNITLLGEKKHEEVLEMMKRTEILLLSSFHEAFPTVILEAMNMKNVVLATKYDGISDELLHSDNSIVTPFDVQIFAEELNKLMHNDKKRKQMQEKAYETCQSYVEILGNIENWL